DRFARGTLFLDRNYFGVVHVREMPELLEARGVVGIPPQPRRRSLVHGTTEHGSNYVDNPTLRRLASTYYHRRGPVGQVMERFDWFAPHGGPVGGLGGADEAWKNHAA